MSDNNEEFWKKMRADEQENATREQAWRELETARQQHARTQQQTREHYDRIQRGQLEMYRQMADKKRLEADKILSKEQLADVNNQASAWFDKRSAAIQNIQNHDPAKEIAKGSMQSFDKQANEILEKGNVSLSLAFLNQAARLAQSQYDAFNTRQDSLAQRVEEHRQNGNEDLAKIFEARKDYEAAAYERDTAQSVLAKYETLYGKESKNCRDQEAECVELSASADKLFEKLSAVMAAEKELTNQMSVDIENSGSKLDKITSDNDPGELDYGTPNFDGPEWAEARADAALIAMDRGEEAFDHEQDDFEHLIEASVSDLDYDEIAQIAEDAHLADVEPDDQVEEIYVAPAVAERKIEEQLSKTLDTTNVEGPSRAFIGLLDAACNREVAARKADDSEGVLTAQQEQMVIAFKFNEFMNARDDFRGALSNLRDDGDALLQAKDSDRALAQSDFKQSYRAADQIIDNLKTENKAWAQPMRKELDAEVETLQRKERGLAPSGEAANSSDVSRIMPVIEEAKREKKEQRSVSGDNDTDAEAVRVNQQAEKERRKEKETQH